MAYLNITNLTDTTTIDEIGGLKYFLIHINDYLLYIILYIGGTLVGILGITFLIQFVS
jgi:hypothetical protein